MSIHVALTHRTAYRYDRAVTARAADHPPAAGAACAHAHPVLCAGDRAEAAFPQLAAGPAGQFPRPRRVPRKDHPFRRDRRSGRRSGDRQPVRLLPGARGGRLAVRLRSDPRQRAGAVPPARPAGAAAGGAAGRGAARDAAHGGHAGRCQPPGAGADILYRAPGAGGVDARADADGGQGELPGFGLAAGAVAAPSGLRGALRVRLPDPAGGRRQAAGGAGRADAPISPTCTPGPRCICPAPAGSGSTRPPG